MNRRAPELISVIVTTYNWPQALDLVLDSLAHQQGCGAYEVIVADDGSGEETRALVDRWRADYPVTLRHVWQPDEGFRAARVRNRGLAEAKGDYIVFLDGDCLCRPNFVATHARLAEPGWFVSGRRVLLRPEPTAQVLRDRAPIHRLPGALSGAWGRRLMKKSHLRRLRNLPLGGLRKLRPWDWRPIQSFNLGVWRGDAFAVGGFDESFVGYGYEDTDLVMRLFRLGRRAKQGFLASAALHLHHDRSPLTDERETRWAGLRAQTHVRARETMLHDRS